MGDERIQRWCQSSKQKIRPETIERYQQCRGCKSRGTVRPKLWPAWLEARRRIFVSYGQEKYKKQGEHYTKGDDPRFVRDGKASVFQHLMPPLFIIRLAGSVSIYVTKIIRSRHQVAEVQ